MQPATRHILLVCVRAVLLAFPVACDAKQAAAPPDQPTAPDTAATNVADGEETQLAVTPPSSGDPLVREFVLSKIDVAAVAADSALVFTVEQGDLAADLCQDGCKLDSSHLKVTSPDKVQAYMWLRSASDPGASSLIELQCVKNDCKQLTDQPIAFSKDVLKTLPQPGKLTPKDAKKVDVTVAKLSGKDPFTAVSQIIKELRGCATDDMIIRPEDDNAIDMRLSIPHPDGFAHLMLADVQIYFPAVANDGVELPPRARIRYASWKSFDNPRAYAKGFPPEQHDFKSFMEKVDKCLERLA
jgi:hypothetical protein